MPSPKAPKAPAAKPPRQIDPKVRAIAERVKEHLTTLYGTSVRQVIVFGDHARGAAGPDSVLEIAAVVDDPLIPRDVERTLEDLLFDVLMEDGELASAIVLHDGQYRDYASPLIARVKDEGVAV
jgi:predicted nucleotidyltransferase